MVSAAWEELEMPRLRKAMSNRQRCIMRKGRARDPLVVREPNGRASRSVKARVDPTYSWFAPRITREMSKHPIDFLADKGAINEDQQRAAFAWIADRAASGLPYAAPHGLNLTGVRAAAEDYSRVSSARQYNEASHILKQRCGVYGHTLIYEACILGKRNTVIDQYFGRLSRKPALDPTKEQTVAWQHLLMAFEELERYYGAQPKRKTIKPNAAVDSSKG